MLSSNVMDKNKKTLTISLQILRKKLTLVKSIPGKNFSVEKKLSNQQRLLNCLLVPNFNQEVKKRNFARKFIEQQATKAFYLKRQYTCW